MVLWTPSSPSLKVLLIIVIFVGNNNIVISGAQSSLTRPRRGQLFKKLKEISSSNTSGGRRISSRDNSSKNNIETLRLLIKTFNHPSPTSVEDTDPERLFAKLGDGFNSVYQSVTEPLNLGQVVKILPGDGGGVGSRDSSTTRTQMPSKGTVPRSLDTMIPLNVRRYLENLSYCPLAEKWIDLGVYLWPRYFKFTHCVRKKCSYPEGLRCQPAETYNDNDNSSKSSPPSSAGTLLQVPLLYWTCMPQQLRKEGSKSCGTWSKIYVDVVSRCKCSGCGGGTNG